MTVTNMTCGAVTASGWTVATKVTSTSDVRVAVSTSADMSSPAFFGPVTPDGTTLMAKVAVTGRAASTRYWWRVEHGGVIDTTYTGQVLTHPTLGQAASFAFAAGSCAGSSPVTAATGSVLAASRISNHLVFDTIRTQALARNWLFFAQLGDLHYYDLGSGDHGIAGGNTLANYRRGIDDVLLQPRQHLLYHQVPWVYVWDDHDYGPNDSDGTLANKANAATCFREKIPHYTLPSATSIYHSFEIGRVLIVASDVRYERSPNADTDNSSKTMLGAAQKTWLTDLLASTSAKALIWLMPDQWLREEAGSDSWGAFKTERAELVTILGSWASRTLMVSGDLHHLGAQSGAGNDYGGFPVIQSSPLDSGPHTPTASRWDKGHRSGGRGYWASIHVHDTGSHITLVANGWVGSKPKLSTYVNIPT